MLFLAKKNMDLDFAFEIGNFGVGAFKLGVMTSGHIQLVGEQSSKPYKDIATFHLATAGLTQLGWGTLGFMLRVMGMSNKSSAKLPLSISVLQGGDILKALDQSNNSMNGAQAPFSPVLADLLSPGIPRDFGFGVHFQ
nr:hypothetical protein [uncultured Sphingomonas sp.]